MPMIAFCPHLPLPLPPSLSLLPLPLPLYREIEVVRLVGKDTIEEILKCAQQKLKLKQEMTSIRKLHMYITYTACLNGGMNVVYCTQWHYINPIHTHIMS